MSQTPKGPRGLPFVGNLFDFANHPAHFFLRITQQYGDIAHFKLGKVDGYAVAQPDAIQDVLIRKKDLFTKSELSRQRFSRIFGDSLLVSVGEYHSRQRRLTQPAFHANRIQAYVDTMVDYTQNMLDKWDDNSVRDIHDEMMILTMEIVSKTLFGSNVADDAIKVGQAIAFLQTLTNIRMTNPFAGLMMKYTKLGQQARDAVKTMDSVVMRFIGERHAQGLQDTGDLLSMLLLSVDENGERMNDKEVRDEAVTLFSAGHETTSNALTWSLYLLAQNPDARQKLFAEVDSVLAGRTPTLADLKHLPYTQMVIKEALRLYPPAWSLMARVALEDVEIGGYLIPAGTNVFLSQYAMHRNSRYWEDVNAFKPERFSPENEKNHHRYQYFPFGGGEHICIGNMFAMMEAQLVLATIASRFELALETSQPVAERALITLFPRDGLPMRIKQRVNVPQPALALN